MNFAINITKLTWAYGKTAILKDINLQVPYGSVFGFIGHNGAGKTTTMKLILNLLDAPENTIEVMGMNFRENRSKILRDIGSLIETPGIYGHLSAYENLKCQAILSDIPTSQIEETLALVNLSYTGSKKAKHFSQGMRQRLGIALALLRSPKLLLLDEPTNGLDPAGILEIRTLLEKLSNRGCTVLISSHLLSEVEKFVTHLAIIDKGEIKFQGALSELQQMQDRTLRIICDPIDLATVLLEKEKIPFSLNDGELSVRLPENKNAANLNRLLNDAKINVSHLSLEKTSLEQQFFSLTNQ